VLVEDMGQTYLAEPDADGEESRTLGPLHAAAITYRIAFGPRTGQKVLTLSGAMPREATPRQPLCADIDGFSLHAAVRIEADNRKRLHLIRFHGVLAPNAKLRPLVVPQDPPAQAQAATEAAATAQREVDAVLARPRRISWSRLLKRVFDIEMQHCPNCSAGELKIIAAILERPVIEKILTHLGLDPQPPPRGRAREAGQDRSHLSRTCGHNPPPKAATPNRSRGGVARRLSAARSKSGSTPRTRSPASVKSDEGPTKAAMRDITVANPSNSDRHRSTSGAFENTMCDDDRPYALAQPRAPPHDRERQAAHDPARPGQLDREFGRVQQYLGCPPDQPRSGDADQGLDRRQCL
jgi:hypothetical protein